MRALVVGASGLVGRHALRAFRGIGPASGTAFSHLDGGLVRLDIRDSTAVHQLVRSDHPDLIVLAAAEPWVDLCEREPQRTRLVNVDGTRNVAIAASEVGAGLVFFSTDYVFDGKRGGYREEDAVSPINEYGRQKVEAESIVLDLPRSLVCRSSGVFGIESQRKNFVYQVVDRLGRGEPVHAPSDQVLCPTPADELTSAVRELTRSHVTGLVHVAGPEALPRVEFARRIARTFGFTDASIEGVPTSDLGASASRPPDSSLRCDRLVALTGRTLEPIDAALQRMRAAMQPSD